MGTAAWVSKPAYRPLVRSKKAASKAAFFFAIAASFAKA
jgi:hypothetical protein